MLLFLEKKVKMESVTECQPPEFVLPGSKERPIIPLHPIAKETSVCL